MHGLTYVHAPSLCLPTCPLPEAAALSASTSRQGSVLQSLLVFGGHCPLAEAVSHASPREQRGPGLRSFSSWCHSKLDLFRAHFLMPEAGTPAGAGRAVEEFWPGLQSMFLVVELQSLSTLSCGRSGPAHLRKPLRIAYMQF